MRREGGERPIRGMKRWSGKEAISAAIGGNRKQGMGNSAQTPEVHHQGVESEPRFIIDKRIRSPRRGLGCTVGTTDNREQIYTEERRLALLLYAQRSIYRAGNVRLSFCVVRERRKWWQRSEGEWPNSNPEIKVFKGWGGHASGGSLPFPATQAIVVGG